MVAFAEFLDCLLTRLHFSDRFETEKLWQLAFRVILGQFGQFQLVLSSLGGLHFSPRQSDVGRQYLHFSSESDRLSLFAKRRCHAVRHFSVYLLIQSVSIFLFLSSLFRV